MSIRDKVKRKKTALESYQAGLVIGRGGLQFVPALNPAMVMHIHEETATIATLLIILPLPNDSPCGDAGLTKAIRMCTRGRRVKTDR